MIVRGLVPAIALNLAILVAPSMILGRFTRDDPVVLAFLTIASTMILADAPTIRQPSRTARTGRDRQAVRWAALTGILILIIFWASLLDRSIAGQSPVNLGNLAGGLLMLLGVGLRASAVRTLRSAFITEPGDGPIVDQGVYAWIRHPSESGNLTVAFGASILLESRVGFAISLLALLPVVLRRVQIEDQDLHDRFANEFARYADRTGGLIPRRWVRSPVPSFEGGRIGRTPVPKGESWGTGACESSDRGAR